MAKPVDIPCGNCPDCRKRKINGWAFRLQQEEKVSSSAFFLTLTYDTNTVPITENGYLSLDKRDVQLFFKKLRKTHSQKLKYYLCGEYGGETKRPHYHVILFNARQDLIQPAWIHGHIYYGTVGGASIAYTLKYISKPKYNLPEGDDRQPEFSLMSKGLGASYLTPQMIAYHKNDLFNRMVHTIEGGKKIAMPRYYKDKIYSDLERHKIQIKAQADAERKREEEQNSLVCIDEKIVNTYTGEILVKEYASTTKFDKEFAAKEQARIAEYKRQKMTSQKNDKL